MCGGCVGVFLSALSYTSQEKKSREKHPEEGLYAPSCPRCSGTKAPVRKNTPAMSRPSPAPAPPYARAHVTRGLRPPCRQATPTPPTPKARHSYAPPMRRARPTRTPREPHGCRTLAPQTRRAPAEFLTHIACTKPAKTSGIRQPCAPHGARGPRSGFASRAAHKGRVPPLRPLPEGAACSAPRHLEPLADDLPGVSSQAQAKTKPNQA